MNETLQLMWDTRPPRIPKKQGGDAMISGICEGIGVRYQIDPSLVRIAFVALSLAFGVGIFMYVLCGFLMPRFGLSTSPSQAISTPKRQLDPVEVKERDTGWGLLILLVLFFPTISVGTPREAFASTIGWLLLSAVAWWALYRRLPEPPPGVIAQPEKRQSSQPQSGEPGFGEPGFGEPGFGDPEPQPATASARNLVTSGFTAPQGYPHPAHGHTGPPSWDPLGTVPELWHLPDPGYEPPQQPSTKRNRPLWVWIPVALLLTIATFVTMVAVSEIRNRDWSRFGQTIIAFPDAEGIHPVNTYVGELTVDLTDLQPMKEPVTLDISQKVGSVEVLMPDEKVRARVNCDIDVGDTACPPEEIDGDGELLTINIHQNVGSIQVAWAK